MTRQIFRLTAMVVIPFALQIAASADSGSTGEMGLGLTIRLYDYAKPGPTILEFAKQEASRILDAANVAVVWLDCPLTMEDRKENSACSDSPKPTDVLIRILPPAMHPKAVSGPGTLGHALVGGDVRTPTIASVFFGNVERLAWARDIDSSYGVIHRSVPVGRYLGILLGHVIAHEIGHLLLESNRHSRRGLMLSYWDPGVTKQAILRQIHFNESQVQIIRRNLSRRTGEASNERPAAGANL